MNRYRVTCFFLLFLCGSTLFADKIDYYTKGLGTEDWIGRKNYLLELNKEKREFILENIMLLKNSLLSNINDEKVLCIFILTELFQQPESKGVIFFHSISPKRYPIDSLYLNAANRIMPFLCESYNATEDVTIKEAIVDIFVMIGIYNEKVYQLALLNLNGEVETRLRRSSIVLLGHYGYRAKDTLPIIKKYEDDPYLSNVVSWSCERIMSNAKPYGE